MAASPAQTALGLAVRQLRLQMPVSQEALGHESGLHRNYVSGIERGERNPTYNSLIRLAQALGVRVSELIALAEKLDAGIR